VHESNHDLSRTIKIISRHRHGLVRPRNILECEGRIDNATEMGNKRCWHFRRGLGVAFVTSMDGIEKYHYSRGILRTTCWSCRKYALPACGKLGYSHRMITSFCAQEAYLDARISIYIMDPSPLSPHNQQKHLGLQIGVKMLTRFYRSSHRIPGHWPPSAHRGKPSAQAVPNENLCTKHRGCKVSFLVLLDEAPKGQEGERRDR
jgi:hypothetical protein